MKLTTRLGQPQLLIRQPRNLTMKDVVAEIEHTSMDDSLKPTECERETAARIIEEWNRRDVARKQREKEDEDGYQDMLPNVSGIFARRIAAMSVSKRPVREASSSETVPIVSPRACRSLALAKRLLMSHPALASN